MPSPRIKYPTYTDCLRFLFSFLRKHYSFNPKDPLPNYRKEYRGSDGLRTILKFCRNDRYYPTLEAKAAYIFVGLIEGHHYSNGNKRLALVITLYFLILNNYELKANQKEIYDLALFIADQRKNKGASFDNLKTEVESYFVKYKKR